MVLNKNVYKLQIFVTDSFKKIIILKLNSYYSYTQLEYI